MDSHLLGLSAFCFSANVVIISCIAADNSWALSFGRGMDIVVSPTCKSRGPVEAEREGEREWGE